MDRPGTYWLWWKHSLLLERRLTNWIDAKTCNNNHVTSFIGVWGFLVLDLRHLVSSQARCEDWLDLVWSTLHFSETTPQIHPGKESLKLDSLAKGMLWFVSSLTVCLGKSVCNWVVRWYSQGLSVSFRSGSAMKSWKCSYGHLPRTSDAIPSGPKSFAPMRPSHMHPWYRMTWTEKNDHYAIRNLLER